MHVSSKTVQSNCSFIQRDIMIENKCSCSKEVYGGDSKIEDN